MNDHEARQKMFIEHNTIPREEHDMMAKAKKDASDKEFIKAMDKMAEDIYRNAKEHGWWESERNDGEMMMLMVTEIAEACEGDRAGNPPDDKIPAFSSIEAELADCVIRIMDYCYQRGYNLPEAILAKHDYNKNRPYKHGGKKY
jgi:NTP pyrophosphatase (non-canonical NTP hydrolase)